jgi:hypothetical protein
MIGDKQNQDAGHRKSPPQWRSADRSIVCAASSSSDFIQLEHLDLSRA